MFGKKLLSLISLLFAGSQLISMANAGTCSITLTVGSTPGSNDSCDVDNCPLGFYKVTGSAYTEGQEFTLGASEAVTKYVKVTGASACTLADTVANEAACEGGKFETTGEKFCLDGVDKNTVTLGNGNNYLFEDVSNLFGDGANALIALKSTAESVIKDETFNEGNNYDYCVDDKMVIFSDRRSGLCDSNSDCNYYHCTSAVCTASPKNLKRQTNTCNNSSECTTMGNGDGYYIVDADNGYTLETTETVGDLWKCEGTTCTKQNDIPLGFLVNKGNGGGTNPYIECKLNGAAKECKPVSISADGLCAASGEGAVTTGKLFRTSGSTYNLCLDASTSLSIDLTTDSLSGARKRAVDSKGQYMISIASSLFGIAQHSNYFIVLDVDEEGNVTVVKEATSVRYRYTDGNGSNKYKIYSRTDAKAATGDNNDNGKNQICYTGTNNPAFEYMKDEWTTELDEDTNVDFYVEGVNAI